METAILIEKITEGYDSEEMITKFIKLLLFPHEVFVEMVIVITAVQH